MRPEKEYGQTMTELEIITHALSLGDLYEIKQWIARGNDVNSSVSATDQTMTPLKYLIKDIGSAHRRWNSPTSKIYVGDQPNNMTRIAREVDFYDAIEILCQKGAIISSDVMNEANELKKSWFSPNPKVRDLLVQLDEKKPPTTGLFVFFLFFFSLFSKCF